MPDAVLDCVEALLNTHSATDARPYALVANTVEMTDALNKERAMTKEQLFNTTREHFEFIDAKLVVFAYGDDKYSQSAEGHWLVFVVVRIATCFKHFLQTSL